MVISSAYPMANTDEVHERIYKIITDTEEITWKSIIMDLIRSEDMDPWNINISLLTKKYIQAVRKFKEANLRISGKVLLAAALLLRIKSSRLIGEDIMEFDRLLATTEEDLYSEESFVEGELGALGVQIQKPENLPLIPRTPQPRKRKVSVYDLIDALDVALNVKKRRVLNHLRQKELKLPDKKFDISKLMDDLMKDVAEYLNKNSSKKVAFSHLVPSQSKHDKVLTFIPMLHLKNARKIDLEQHKHFEEIWIKLIDRKEVPAQKDSDKKE